MKKKMSLTTSKCVAYIASGIGWLFFSVLSLFDNEVSSLIASVVLVICLAMSVISHFLTNEFDDEMSKHNLMKAQAATMYWLKTIICVILMLFAIIKIFDFDVIDYKADLKFVLSMVFAITDILTGALFAKYEKAGE